MWINSRFVVVFTFCKKPRMTKLSKDYHPFLQIVICIFFFFFFIDISIWKYYDFELLFFSFAVITEFFFTENMHISETYYYIMYKGKMVLRGRSQTKLTSFGLFLTTYPPPVTFLTLWTLTKSQHFWTNYPHLL